MRKILSIVFLVIPLLFFTYACGEETQATEAPRIEQIAPAVRNAVEKAKTAVETATSKVAEAVKVTEEPVVEAVEPVETEVVVAVAPVVMAASHEEGAQLFKQNCAACHAGGGNLVAANKTLKKEALEKYDMYSKEAIVYQVTNGKNAMPAFGKRLSSEQIESLAGYVLAQADKGW
ncbi:cytochrome c, mono- and diheme variants family [Rivularia sp. PCC 7116]|uniref:cytochrome c6 PetJ n=1 Tax=Rivularia sp. PCC 7116 TaxID=373994 RepID=UPI00029F3566|nr:cytochrome c, mono- and diheme variants family [Rivularia sp. PCC 7116]